MMVTVDGGVFEALLSNMVPGKTYQVTVSSMKGLEESDPSTDTVTTGGLSLCPPASALITSASRESHTSVACLAALDRPQGLTVVNITDTSALLLWQPTYATVDGYLVTYSADTGGVFSPFSPPSGKFGLICADCFIDGLVPPGSGLQGGADLRELGGVRDGLAGSGDALHS